MNAVPSPIVRRIAAIAVVLGFLVLLTGYASQNTVEKDLERQALWEVVHDICVPGQMLNHNPVPCVQVDLHAGSEKGFAILQDPRGPSHFMLVPTARMPGIESPLLLQPDATNYFAGAWDARRYVFAALGKMLPRDDVGMAINSAASRSQDQLHIHIDCVEPAVRASLHKNEPAIGAHWAPFPAILMRRRYLTLWVPGDDLGSSNPFRLLADGLPVPARDIGNWTLVAVGFTRADGSNGFVLLADRVGTVQDDIANGEQLLDHTCRVAAQQSTQQKSQ
jgi:CDP-diacylglycerol pyrophosphatase